MILLARVAALLLVAVIANAQVPTTLAVEAPAMVLAGDLVTITARISHAGAPCPATLPPAAGSVVLKGDTRDIGGFLVQQICASGTYTDVMQIATFFAEGDHALTVQYTGGGGLAPAVSTPFIIRAGSSLSGLLRQGTAKLSIVRTTNSFQAFCAAHAASFDAGIPDSAPPGVSFPLGFVRYDFTQCGFDCGFPECPGFVPRYPQQNVTLEMPQALPQDASVWEFAPGGGLTTPTWRRLQATIDGTRVTVALDGNDLERELRGILAVGTGDGARADLQDMWWAGPQENGWGMSIAQVGDRLVAGLFVYRDDGTPVWAVMPGGAWDTAHATFTGDLYTPFGSWLGSYDASRLQVGPPVGTARFTPSSSGAGRFEYTIGGKSGSKAITHLPFGASVAQGPYAGLWWGGIAKNGWGLAIGHQADTLFAVWFTYDKSGAPVWYVMPGGQFASAAFGQLYKGTLYRTSGAPWVGATYDPSRLVVTPVGSLNIQFTAPDAALMSWTVDGVSGTETLYKEPF